MSGERPKTDQRPPAEVVAGMVERVLALANTWLSWDGEVRTSGDRAYTPHKAIRRVADHLIDHLADLEMRFAGVPTMPDRWHASAMTTPADMAQSTQEDLEEAESRLLRLAKVWSIMFESLSDEELDQTDGERWTPREVAFHLEESAFYAEAVGAL
jgi:hypothetical protein